MPLPFSVNVLGQEFPVITVPNLKGEDGHPHYGRVSFDPHRIEINSSEPDDVQHNTLLHEIIHAAIRIGGLSAILDEVPVPGIEEAIVCNLDRALSSALYKRTKRSKPVPLLPITSSTQ